MNALQLPLALPEMDLPPPARYVHIRPPVVETIEELAELYLTKRELSDESVRTYRVGMSAAGRVLVGGRPMPRLLIAEVTRGQAQRCYDELVEVSGPATAEKFVKLLRAAHRFAIQRGAELPAECPWSSVERVTQELFDIAFPEHWLRDVIALVGVAASEGEIPARAADFFTLCLATGARPWCEVLRMRWQDIDPGRSITFAFSKRTKQRRKKVRSIPYELLCTAAVEALDRQRSESVWVWPGRGEGHAAPSTFGKCWTPFRNWAASRIMMADVHGQPLALVRAGRHGLASHLRDMLGHADLRTQQRYVHLSGRHLREPARLVSASLEPRTKRNMDQLGISHERFVTALDWLERRAGAASLAGGEPLQLEIPKEDGGHYSKHAITSWRQRRREPPTPVAHWLAHQIATTTTPATEILLWLFGEIELELPKLEVRASGVST